VDSESLRILAAMLGVTAMIHAVVVVHAPETLSRTLFIIATWPVWVIFEICLTLHRVALYVWKKVFQRKNKEE
jgi:hypothetical protein